MIRWGGFIGIIVFVLLLSGFWILYADIYIERFIEEVGTRLVGAKVEARNADLILFPAGLEVTGLEVTNPRNPMRNAFEIERIAMTLNGLKLFERKIIIEEMALQALKLNTERKTSGEISRKSRMKVSSLTKKIGEELEFPPLEFPSIASVFEKENLRSLNALHAVREEISAKKKEWNARLSDLPDRKKLEDYRKRIEKIRSGGKEGIEGVLGGTGEWVEVQRELRRDLQALEAAQQGFQTDYNRFHQRVSEVSSAPIDDVRRLVEKHSPASVGLAHLSRLLFGPKISDGLDQAMKWYERAQPFYRKMGQKKGDLEIEKPLRGEGVNVRFKESVPLPDFLIRVAEVSLEIPEGEFSGEMLNVTPDQGVLGKPFQFSFAGRGLKGMESVKINGEFNHVNPEATEDHATFEVRKAHINQWTIAEGEKLSLVMKEAVADGKGRLEIKGDGIHGTLSGEFHSVSWTSAIKDKGSILESIGSALGRIERFDINAGIEGQESDYQLRVSSDLDRFLKDAVGAEIKQKAIEFERRIRARVDAEIQEPMARLKEELEGLKNILEEISSRNDAATQIMKQILNDQSSGFKLPF